MSYTFTPTKKNNWGLELNWGGGVEVVPLTWKNTCQLSDIN